MTIADTDGKLTSKRNVDALTTISRDTALTSQQGQMLRERLRETRAPATHREYAKYWLAFQAWWKAHYPKSPTALEAEAVHVALYLDWMARKQGAYSTVLAHRAAISAAFDSANLKPPTHDPIVKGICKALRRDLVTRAKSAKMAATAEVMERLIAPIDRSTLKGKRDAALLLIGWYGAFRRAALVALDVGDLKREEWGFAVTVKRDKNDQDGRGLVKVIPTGDGGPLDGVLALEVWLDAYARQIAPGGRTAGKTALQPTDGLFPRLRLGARKSHYVDELDGKATKLQGAAVADLIKLACAAAKLPPDVITQLSGHSLRAGFVTEAALRGATDSQIQQQTGHQSLDMLARYRRMRAPQLGNAAMIFAKPKPTQADEDADAVLAEIFPDENAGQSK